MPNSNSTLIKALGTASAVTVLGVLFYYFMTAHFTYVDKNTAVMQESIRTQQELVSVVERLDNTISSKSGQAGLRASIIGPEDTEFKDPRIVKKFFPVTYDSSDPHYIPPAVSSDETTTTLKISEDPEVLKVLENLDLPTTTVP